MKTKQNKDTTQSSFMQAFLGSILPPAELGRLLEPLARDLGSRVEQNTLPAPNSTLPPRVFQRSRLCFLWRLKSEPLSKEPQCALLEAGSGRVGPSLPRRLGPLGLRRAAPPCPAPGSGSAGPRSRSQSERSGGAHAAAAPTTDHGQLALLRRVTLSPSAQVLSICGYKVSTLASSS